MRFSRQMALVLFILLVALVVGACAPMVTPMAPTPTPVPSPTTQEAPATPTPAPYPLTVTDDLGREVTIPGRPDKIISLAPSNSEILFAVGAGDQVVGVTQYCNYPPEACQAKEVIGGFSPKSMSIEKILALEPDVVFSAGSFHMPVIEALEKAGVPVVALDPQGFEGIYDDILLVGQITDHAEEAEALVADMKARVAAVTAAVADIPAEERLKVFYEVWDEPLMTAGPDTFIGQMIELAGGVNIFGDMEEQYPQVSAEVVIERNPDVILGPDSHADALTPEKIAARPGWENIKAVQTGRIYTVNGDIVSRAGPRVVDALETIAQLLYPERFQ